MIWKVESLRGQKVHWLKGRCAGPATAWRSTPDLAKAQGSQLCAAFIQTKQSAEFVDVILLLWLRYTMPMSADPAA